MAPVGVGTVGMLAAFGAVPDHPAAAAIRAEKVGEADEQSRLFDDRADAAEKVLRGEGLGEKFVNTGIPGEADPLRVAKRGNDDEGCVEILAQRIVTHAPDEIERINPGRPVGNDQIGPVLGEITEGVGNAGCRRDLLDSELTQDVAHDPAHLLVPFRH